MEIRNKTYEDTLNLLNTKKAQQTDTKLMEVYANNGLTYVNCTFESPVISFVSKSGNGTLLHVPGNLTFIQCHFKATVNLRHIIVEGRTVFDNCTFVEAVTMENADFRGDTFFRNNDFLKPLSMQNVRFARKAYFMDSQCSDQASFQGAIFNGDAQFSVTKFYGYTDFSLARFRQHAFFNYAEFPDVVIFNYTASAGRFELKSSILNRIEMKDCRFDGNITAKGFTLGKSFDLSGSRFAQALPEFPNKYANLINLSNVKVLKWSSVK